MRFLPAALLALLLPVCSATADEIPPPFGFRWSDTASFWAEAAKAMDRAVSLVSAAVDANSEAEADKLVKQASRKSFG